MLRKHLDEVGLDLDGQQVCLGRHGGEQRAGGAAGARTQLDDAACLAQFAAGDDASFQEAGAGDDRAHDLGLAQEASEESEAVAFVAIAAGHYFTSPKLRR